MSIESITALYPGCIAVCVTHGVEIGYDEECDLWRFCIAGKDRHAKSLKNAKAAIVETFKPDQKKNTFKRCTALTRGYPEGKRVEVTTQTEQAREFGRDTEIAFWVKDGDKRTKARLQDLCSDCADNVQVFLEIESIREQVTNLHARLVALKSSLKPFVPPAAE